MSRITKIFQGFDEGGSPAPLPLHRHPLGRKINPCIQHPRNGLQSFLDGSDTANTVDGGHREFAQALAWSDLPAFQPELILDRRARLIISWRVGRSYHHRGAAAAHVTTSPKPSRSAATRACSSM